MKTLSLHHGNSRATTRNPERSRERILQAAFEEFAAKGFAGARVDSIARRAAINKRMLYHYFGDKQTLFREVLRRKMAERQAWGEATPDDPAESLPYWFDLARKDVGWIRLLEWEALQFVGKRLIDQESRRKAAVTAAAKIRKRQEGGHLCKKFTPRHTLLAMLALTWFPVAFPQMTRLIMGQWASDERFIREHREFLARFSAAFQDNKFASRFRKNAHALAAGLVIMAGLLFAGCSRSPNGADAHKKTEPASVPVIVAQAEAADVPVELNNVGNVEAFSTVTIRSQITGQITKVHFKEGDEVKQGDKLFTIDPRPLEGALRQAEADLKRDQAQLVSARLEFERTKKLLESSIASRDDYDKAESAFHALEATVMADEAAISRAKLQVEFTSLQSPIDGRTGNLMVKEGNIVKAPDDALVTINQVHPIYVTFSVPEQDLPAIRRRMKQAPLIVEARISTDAAADDPASDPPHGELSFIDNAVDAMTGRIKLKATFVNTNNTLWPGQFVQTTLTLSRLSHATVVPAQAVQSSQTGDFVFVMKTDATVQKRPVVVGLRHGNQLVIENGVQPGETVVVDGQLRLKEGSRVVAQKGGVTSATEAAGGALP